MGGNNSQPPEGAIAYAAPARNWSPSPGIAGIDQHHTFARPGMKDPGVGIPLGNPTGGPSTPDSAVASIPAPGPSAGGFVPPPQNDAPWWMKRNQSSNQFDEFQGEDGKVTTPIAQHNTLRTRDPRTAPIPVERWTARQGPVAQYLYTRNPLVRDMTGMKRFHPDPGTTFAYTPSLRPSPAALGDGRGSQRFRTTQREVPSSLDSQIVSNDQLGMKSGPVLPMGGTLSQRWF